MAGTSKQTIGHKDDKDYIGLLPDCLIHHIFSFMPTKDVIKTCVLSKRWRSVWTTVWDLNFSVSSYDESFVDRVLTQYAWAKVKKFHLFVRSGCFDSFKIDSWLRFAVDHQVEELLLTLNNFSGTRVLSPLLCNCSSLTKLCLSECLLLSSESITSSSLKSLSMESVILDDDAFRKILMGSPVLEYLNLKSCHGIKGIHSASLKELVIENNFMITLQISTPRLLSLRVINYSYFEKIRIVETPSLLEAELDFKVPPTIADSCLLKQMFCKLQNATRILFGSWWAWVAWPLKVEDMQLSLPNCKSLSLHVPIPNFGFPAIANVLATTPNLEKLVIILKPCYPHSNVSDPDIKKKLERWAGYLKNIDIFICAGNMVIKVMKRSQNMT